MHCLTVQQSWCSVVAYCSSPVFGQEVCWTANDGMQENVLRVCTPYEHCMLLCRQHPVVEMLYTTLVLPIADKDKAKPVCMQHLLVCWQKTRY